ncbi:GGDEF domain-containing protein [Pseudoalteromonas denitrificans]|uniref:diguanylate cyclase n=1 Tax=Pseudoalteromonas denitrificans DSM 6059 TaxID=1123010 RepID=A0A1I1UCW7_9GAMM|nr:GGDEF domain-containing protein [Pseudoalteromonas denitrificans]SFD67448.1 diguanylate cyclase [Pseudoalteromonas denitrificans DSM 6059]
MQEQREENDSCKEMPHQPHVVSLFALVGMSICAVMAVTALFNNNVFLTSSLFFASFIYFVAYFVYKKYDNVQLSSAIVLYSLYLLMFYLVYTGGVEQTGPLWVYVVAPVSVFIHGLKRGLIDIAVFIFIISLIMFIPTDIVFHTTYSTEFKLRLIFSFSTVTFLSALYEYSREKSYKHMLELNFKYQQLAHIDPLTKLSNRRNALNILQQEQSRIERNKEALSIILCDVDHFKHINDKYGHSAGDAVLVELSHLFNIQMRKQDCISRWGGEEFLFILPQTNAENANVIAEKILLKLNKYALNYNDEKIKVTVSMGIAQFDGSQSIDAVINNADNLLYQAKNSGRNQIFPKFENNKT